MKSKQTYSELLNRIEGQDAVELNKIAQEYKLLEKELKEKNARFSELKDIIKTLGEGGFETDEYMFNLYMKKGSKTLDKTVLEKLYPNVYEDERIYKIGTPSLVLDKVERKS